MRKSNHHGVGTKDYYYFFLHYLSTKKKKDFNHLMERSRVPLKVAS